MRFYFEDAMITLNINNVVSYRHVIALGRRGNIDRGMYNFYGIKHSGYVDHTFSSRPVER